MEGRRERVLRGLPPGGNVAYGYRRNGRSVEIEKSEAEMVRMIFQSRADGLTPTNIAILLSARGCARRNGKPWTQRQVAAVLDHRDLYKEGRLRYGDVGSANTSFTLLE